jgi:hypothetical protein
MNIDFLRLKTERLWHPESPGMKVDVTRSWIERIFNPLEFATLNECIISYNKPINSKGDV